MGNPIKVAEKEKCDFKFQKLYSNLVSIYVIAVIPAYILNTIISIPDTVIAIQCKILTTTYYWIIFSLRNINNKYYTKQT